ncbi:hypothetical protein DMENIID0001_031100 [Sergentomyia squamirostris]
MKVLVAIPFLVVALVSTVWGERVVGGSNAENPYPYQISLQLLSRGKYRHICGGSIVNERYAVTAAHCVERFQASQLQILAGTTTLSHGGETYKVQEFHIHPDYQVLYTSDIALMRTDRPFNLSNSNIEPVTLTDEYAEGGEEAVLTGWGNVIPFRPGVFPDNLQQVSLMTLSHSTCNNFHNLSSTEICTTRLFGGACSGDSGGPLVRKKDKKQIGVVSYGLVVCGSGYPDVFTRVSVFRPWINELTSLNEVEETPETLGEQ